MPVQLPSGRGSAPHSFATASILGALVALVHELSRSGHIDAKRYTEALDALQEQSATEVVSENDKAMTAMVIRVIKEAANKGVGDE